MTPPPSPSFSHATPASVTQPPPPQWRSATTVAVPIRGDAEASATRAWSSPLPPRGAPTAPCPAPSSTFLWRSQDTIDGCGASSGCCRRRTQPRAPARSDPIPTTYGHHRWYCICGHDFSPSQATLSLFRRRFGQRAAPPRPAASSMVVLSHALRRPPDPLLRMQLT
ncbi:uncharacterized protein [Triticum aestivum]|uniref:uncharacterized protein n=1 Tax=Triticum aestivum TaxID=4565 RepID=UPI001D01513C|nr:uncharacterized protein LOC123092789 [Triticum aestivum]